MDLRFLRGCLIDTSHHFFLSCFAVAIQQLSLTPVSRQGKEVDAMGASYRFITSLFLYEYK